MAVCAKCKRVLPGGAKACRSCGEPLPVGTAKRKDLLKPKMSIEEALQKTNTDIVRAPLPIKKIFLFSTLAILVIALLFVAKSAMVLFDGSGKEYQEKIFYDPIFGLMWAKAKTEPILYEEADRYCKDMVIGEIDDWRLSTITELRTLVKGCPATDAKGKCPVRETCFAPECLQENCKGCEADKGAGEESLYWQPRIWEHTTGWSKTFYWSSTERKELVGEPAAGEKAQVWTASFVTGEIAAKELTVWGHARCVSGPVPMNDRLRQYFMFLK